MWRLCHGLYGGLEVRRSDFTHKRGYKVKSVSMLCEKHKYISFHSCIVTIYFFILIIKSLQVTINFMLNSEDISLAYIIVFGKLYAAHLKVLPKQLSLIISYLFFGSIKFPSYPLKGCITSISSSLFWRLFIALSLSSPSFLGEQEYV